MPNQVHPFPDSPAAAQACGQFVTACLLQELDTQPEATIALSGGSSPKPLFTFLADAPIPWDRVHIFWVDERCVPPDHEQSNYRLANELLLRHANIPPRCIHRIVGEAEPEQAAVIYAEQLKEYFKLADGEMPQFTLIHQGMGGDGHTASLFPGDSRIEDRTGLTAAVWVEKMQSHRVTLLPGPLLAAKHTVFLADGAEKAEVFKQVTEGPLDLHRFPSQLFVHEGLDVNWFVDRAITGAKD